MNLSLPQGTHALLRIGGGLLFLEHGLQKTFGLLGGFGAPGVAAPLASQFGAAGVLEVIGGTLLAIGLLTRPVAALLAIEMVTAYFIAHAGQGGWPLQNQGELALVYALIFAYFAGNGAGAFSVDEAIPIAMPRERRRVGGDRRHGAPLTA